MTAGGAQTHKLSHGILNIRSIRHILLLSIVTLLPKYGAISKDGALLKKGC